MALLNFANTYAEISGNLSLPESDSGEFVKLFFSKDGHIISHGKDFTPTFAPSVRGLVPTSSGKATEFLRGNATWAQLTTTDLPIAENTTIDTTTTIFNTQQVHQLINESFAANDAMRYKGTISVSGSSYVTHTVAGVAVTGFPTKCNVGDTYRIAAQGTYAGQTCSAGDLLICIKDGTGSSLNAATYWTAVESNINGQVRHTINGNSMYVYSSATTAFTFYAPTTGGTAGQVLISNGSAAPTWTNQSALSVGVAGRVANRLTLLGTGLSFGIAAGYFDGSASRSIALVAATTTNLGGVIVDKDSTNKTISVTSAGSIYLTKQNIINALGYDPMAKDSWRTITIGGVSIGNKTLNFVPSGDVYLKSDANGDDIQDISFGISWYNISSKKYETA